MLFNSLSYLLFLAASAVLWALLPRSARVPWLLVISAAFYSLWKPVFLLLILVATSVDYLVALRLEVVRRHAARRLLLATSIAVNLGILFYFKYLGFAVTNLARLAGWLGVEWHPGALDIILPLGISFYTFEALSYVIDVYRGVYRAQQRYLAYAGFILFFPKLIAGPILRAREFIPQLNHPQRPSAEDLWEGLSRIAIGLFLKVVLADNVAEFVDTAFALDKQMLGGLDVLTLAFLFGYQIYFDFAGYSAIAIGSARLFGITVPENFQYPYLAGSPRSFWQRWHISLSSWIRDYLYLPLTGQRFVDQAADHAEALRVRGAVVAPKALWALFATWAVMGLWHGAQWTFVLWGLMHGCYIAIARLLGRIAGPTPGWAARRAGQGATLIAVMVAWIPFRATSISESLLMLAKIVDLRTYGSLGLRENNYLVAAVMLGLIFLAYALRSTLRNARERRPALAVALVGFAAAVVVVLDVVFLRPINQFIYFQF